MLPATLALDSATNTVTLTDTNPVAPPSGGAAVYRVRSFYPGRPIEVLADWQNGPSVTLGLPSDGVYMLVLDYGDAGTTQAPLSPPTLLDSSIVLTALVTFTAEDVATQLAVRHCVLACRQPSADPVPLNGAYLAITARLYEANALFAESAPDAADRLLRYPLPALR